MVMPPPLKPLVEVVVDVVEVANPLGTVLLLATPGAFGPTKLGSDSALQVNPK